jgi:hypothetical protein
MSNKEVVMGKFGEPWNMESDSFGVTFIQPKEGKCAMIAELQDRACICVNTCEDFEHPAEEIAELRKKAEAFDELRKIWGEYHSGLSPSELYSYIQEKGSRMGNIFNSITEAKP